MSSEAEQTTGDHQAAANASPASLANKLLADAQRVSGKHRPSAPPPLTKVQSGPVMQGRYIPTLSLDPLNVKTIDGFDEHAGFVQCAVEAFSLCHVGLKALGEAREQVKRDPSKTEAQQILLVAKEAEKLQDRMTRAMDKARSTLLAGITHNEAELTKPLTASADSRMSCQVRDLCRSMTESEREKFISEAMKDGDTRVLNAILGAPAALSGLSKQMLQHHTRQFHEQQSPGIAARVRTMRAALEMVEQRAGLIFSEIDKALGARRDVIEKLRKTQDASAQALLLINNPVQS